MQRAFSRIHGSGGFTLIELMVGLVLGLLLIGAVISVFVSNQETYRLKAELDDAQEAFRFGSHTLSRVIRQGTSIEDPAGDNAQLRVVMAHESASDWGGVKDCLGRRITDYSDYDASEDGGFPAAAPAVRNIFSLAHSADHGGQDLTCSVETPDSNNDAGPRILVEGLSEELGDGRWFVRFGLDGDSYWRDSLDAASGTRWISKGDMEAAQWSDVRSVAIRLEMQARRSGDRIGRSSLFVSTLRAPVFSGVADD